MKATFNFQDTIDRNVDVLFELQNSVSDEPQQANLVANVPVFINTLSHLPGGLPNLHIGVVTSDMGAGAFTSSVGGCGNPDNGVFVDKVRASTDPGCATAMLNAGQHFIISANAGTQNNFTGDLSQVFSCLANVGTTGCGFQQHFEAVRAALGDPSGDPTHDIPVRAVPPNNVGFLRPDAILAVISVTDHRECSTPPDSRMFDTSPGADATLGPLQARCYAQTDICDGEPVINYVLAGKAAGPFRSCVSDETTFAKDPTHAAIPVQFYVNYLKSLKADPNKVLVSGIVAPPSPYSLVLLPDGNGGTVVGQGASCTGAAGVFGQPVPRWTTFFGGFDAAHALRFSTCDASYAGDMQSIAETIGEIIGSPSQPCVSGNFRDVNGPHGSRPDCTVVDHSIDASSGNEVDTTLPSCLDNGNQPPCWSLGPGNPDLCPGQQVVTFLRPTTQTLPPGLGSRVECSVCASNEHSTGCP